eukprot:PhM_4_TR17457/c8_g1_i1/m.36653
MTTTPPPPTTTTTITEHHQHHRRSSTGGTSSLSSSFSNSSASMNHHHHHHHHDVSERSNTMTVSSMRSQKRSGGWRPRTLLVMGTTIAMVLTTISIIVLQIILYGNFALEREVVHLENVQNIIYEFAQAFEREFTADHQKEMLDQVQTLGQAFDWFYESAVADRKEVLAAHMESFSEVFKSVAQRELEIDVKMIEKRLLGMADVFALMTTATGGVGGGGVPLIIEKALQQLSVEEKVNIVAVPMDNNNNYNNIVFSTVQQQQQQQQYEQQIRARCFLDNITTARVPFIYSSSSSSSLRWYVCAERWTTTTTAASFSTTSTSLTSYLVSHPTHAQRRYLDSLLQRSKDGITRIIKKGRKDDDAFLLTGEIFLITIGELAHYRGGSSIENLTSARVVIPFSKSMDNGTLALAMLSSDTEFTEYFRSKVVSAVEHLNFASHRTTELVLARVDPLTNRFSCQVTKFRFNATCSEDCYRSMPSCYNAFSTSITHRWSSSITPDYRPEPVFGTYLWLNRFGMALGIERDVLELRTRSLGALSDALDTLNDRQELSLAMHLVRYSGMPASALFDTLDIASCVDPRTGKGLCRKSASLSRVLWRKDCPHCMRRPTIPLDTVEYITGLHDCPVGDERTCRKASHELTASVAAALSEKGTTTTTTTNDVDYRGVSVLTGGAFLSNYSVGVLVKMDSEELEAPVRTVLIITSLSGVGMAVVGLVVLVIVSRNMLNRIDDDFEVIVQAHGMAVDAAIAIADMDLEAVAYLKQLKQPNAIQRSFLQIVTVLEQWRAYLPASLYQRGRVNNNNNNDTTTTTSPPFISPLIQHFNNNNNSASSPFQQQQQQSSFGTTGGIADLILVGPQLSLEPYLDRRTCTIVHVQFVGNAREVMQLFDDRGSHIVLSTVEARLHFLESVCEELDGVILRASEDTVELGFNVTGLEVMHHALKGAKAALAAHDEFNQEVHDDLSATVVLHTSASLCGLAGTTRTRSVVCITRDTDLLPQLREAAMRYRRVTTTPGILAIRHNVRSYAIDRIVDNSGVGDWNWCPLEERCMYVLEGVVAVTSSNQQNNNNNNN